MKEIILGIFFIVGGIAFVCAGFYFRSESYFKALTSGIFEKEKLAEKKLFAQATGIFSVAIGILTILSGVLFFIASESKYMIALTYIIIFALLSIVYTFVFAGNQNKK